MRNLLFGLLCLYGLQAFCQADYQPGYIITQAGQRQTVEIFDVGWSDNPDRVRYRTADGSVLRAGVDEMREFGLSDGTLRYLRATVDMDRSSEEVAELSLSENPEYVRETVFLEWLVEGQANLFYWKGDSRVRFFYGTADESPLPLINRRYRRGQQIIQRATFRGVLRDAVNCDADDRNLRILPYRRPDLVRYFLDYNSCLGTAVTVFEARPKGRPFRVTVRPGVEFSGGDVLFGNGFGGHRENLVEYTPGARLGLEVEWMIPRMNNRWSVFGELYYRSLKVDGKEADIKYAALNLKSLSVPLGIRRYFYLNNDLALFLTAGGALQWPMESFVTEYRGPEVSNLIRSFDASWNFGVLAGAGVRINDRIQLEFRYAHDQDLLQRYAYHSTYLKGYSLIASYRIL